MNVSKSIKTLQDNLIQVISKEQLLNLKGGNTTFPNVNQGPGFTIEDEIIM